MNIHSYRHPVSKFVIVKSIVGGCVPSHKTTCNTFEELQEYVNELNKYSRQLHHPVHYKAVAGTGREQEVIHPD